jgi:hypothetical protein
VRTFHVAHADKQPTGNAIDAHWSNAGLHREVPLAASAIRPSKLLRMFSSPPASFAYSASVNRPAASCALRSLWILFTRFTVPRKGPMLPAVAARAAAILFLSSVAMLFFSAGPLLDHPKAHGASQHRRKASYCEVSDEIMRSAVELS